MTLKDNNSRENVAPFPSGRVGEGLLTTELIKLNNLQLAGKLVSEELLLGIHHSKRFGYGIEFEQYRHYDRCHYDFSENNVAPTRSL